MTTTTRARLIARGLLDASGNVTAAGEAWTDEQVELLRRVANRAASPMVRP